MGSIRLRLSKEVTPICILVTRIALPRMAVCCRARNSKRGLARFSKQWMSGEV